MLVFPAPVIFGNAIVPLEFKGYFTEDLNGLATTVNSRTNNLPETVEASDLLIYVLVGDDAGPTAVNGRWTQIISSTANSVYAGAWYHIGPHPNETMFTWATSANKNVSAYILMHFRGQNQTTPFDVAGQTATSTTGAPNPPSITPVTDGCMILAVGYLDDDQVSTGVTAPSGYSLINANASPSAGSSIMAAYKILPTAAAEDPAAFGIDGNSDAWRAMTLAIRPR